MDDSSSPPASGRFQATRWSIVLRSKAGDTEGMKAMEELCRIYWFPLYAWCRAHGRAAHDAKDLIQGFFLRILRNDPFPSGDPAKAKLRTFLLTTLQRRVRDEDAKACSAKRGGRTVIPIDPHAAETWYANSLSCDSRPKET